MTWGGREGVKMCGRQKKVLPQSVIKCQTARCTDKKCHKWITETGVSVSFAYITKNLPSPYQSQSEGELFEKSS